MPNHRYTFRLTIILLLLCLDIATAQPHQELKEAFHLLSQSKDLVHSGEYSRAVPLLIKADRIFRQFKSQLNLILVCFYLGRAYEGLHKESAADSAFSQSISLYENLSQRGPLPPLLHRLYAQSLYYRAKIASTRDLGLALQWAKMSLNAFQKQKDQQGIRAATSLLRGIYRKIGEPERAKRLRLKQTSDLHLLQNLGEELIAAGQLDSALVLFQRMNEIASHKAFPLAQNIALKYLGYLYFQLGDFPRSQELFQRLLHRIPSPDWYPHLGLARCYLVFGDTSRAMEHLTSALPIIEDLRSSLPLPEQRSSFIADKMDVYNLIVDLSLAQGRSYSTLQYAERAKARGFVEAVLSRHLHHRNRSALDSLLHSTGLSDWLEGTPPLKTIQHILDDQTVILCFFITTSLHLWMVSNQGLQHFSFPRGIIQELMDLRDQIFSHFPKQLLEESLKKLYAQTFETLAPFLRRYRRIILIPHGLLHYFPFAALFDGQHYFIDRFELVYLPNLSLLPLMATYRWNPPRRILVMINPHGLPFVRQEAEWIHGLFPESDILESFRIPKRDLIGVLEGSDADVLHFAMHASLNPGEPLRSYLAIGRGIRLLLADVLGLRLSASIAVLSACATGLGPVGPGDNLKSLSRAFLQAGVPVVLASLWPVRDQSTALLMKYFYRKMKGAQRPSAALKGAIGDLRRENPQFSHPYFWGAFIQLGGFFQ